MIMMMTALQSNIMIVYMIDTLFAANYKKRTRNNAKPLP